MSKLTKSKFYEIMDNFVAADSIYRELLPYLADEQPAEQVSSESVEAFNERIRQHLDSLHPTKPEPSRLEVAKDVMCALMSNKMMPNEPDMVYAINLALKGADMLIKQSKQTP